MSTAQKSPLDNACDAAGGNAPRDAQGDCLACQRSDLSVLVVVPSVVPKEHAAGLSSAGYKWQASFDASFASQPRDATVPVARIPAAGWIFVFYPARSRWDVWQVMQNGLTRKAMHQVDVNAYKRLVGQLRGAPPPKACSRGAANVAGNVISILGAATTDKVWLAYSARLWSAYVLDRFVKNSSVKVGGNAKAVREWRGLEIHPKSILQGQTSGAGMMPLTASGLKHGVVDFCQGAGNGKPGIDFLRAFERCATPLDDGRFGLADAFDVQVRALERASSPAKTPDKYHNTSVVLMLPDDIGVIEQHNHLRLGALEAQRAWAAGGPDSTGGGDDALRSWKLRSALHAGFIEQWVFAENLHFQEELLKAGAYRTHTLIAQSELDEVRARERASGKPFYPAGTQIEQVKGSNPVVYRVIQSDEQVETGLKGVAADRSKGRIERYEGKLRMSELNAFRDAYVRAANGWEKYLAAIDADYVKWLRSTRLASAMNCEFDVDARLHKPDGSHGTLSEQFAEVMGRMAAVEKAWGGGALTQISVQELVKLYAKNPDDPAKWIDEALLEPFSLLEAFNEDKGRNKDVAEKLNLILREVPDTFKEARHALHELHEAHEAHAAGGHGSAHAAPHPAASLVNVRQQATQIQAALVDPALAKKLGLPAVAAQEAERCFTMQVRTTALVDIMLNPQGERYVTLLVKLPTGETLDAVGKAISPPKLETTLETKAATDRVTRRQSRNALKKLAEDKRLAQPEFQPVIVSEAKLAELQKSAAAHGEAMVDVVAEGTLGEEAKALSLPKSTALNLIGEQATKAHVAWKTLANGETAVAGVLGVFQIRALLEAVEKLDGKEGYEYADTLMTVFSSAAGLVEGSCGIVARAVEFSTNGSRIVLVSRVTAPAALRLVGGIFGASSSAFDAVSSFAKMYGRDERGDHQAANAYGAAGMLFAFSSLSLFAGTSIAFVNATAVRYAVSEAALSELGGAAVGEFLGASLSGIGAVLAILGFAATLYAQSLEDDLNEIFLKRSFWGNGEREEKKFGAWCKPEDHDAAPMLKWAEVGLKEESDALQALSVGFKCTLERQKSHGGAMVAKLLCATNNEKRRVDYELRMIPSSDPHALVSVKNAELEVDKESGRYAIEARLPLGGIEIKGEMSAQFSYKVHDEAQVVAQDQVVIACESH